MGTSYVPGTVLDALPFFTLIIHHSWDHYQAHFTDEETEARGDDANRW